MNLRYDRLRLTRPMASDLRSVRARARSVCAAIFVGLAALSWKAYDLAIVSHETYGRLGHRQQLRTYRVEGSRGDIVDRSYVALAVDDRVHKVVLNPRLIRSEGASERVLAALSAAFPTEDPAYLRDELERDKVYRRLRQTLDDAEAATLSAQKLPGLRLEPVPRRVYPRRLLAAHLLGRVDQEGKGNLGLEYALENELRGRDTTSPAQFARGQKLLVDGHPDTLLSRGHTIVSTIDSAIQAILEEEIDTLVETWHPLGTSIIVLDPRSGEVLGMTNRPTFDPNGAVGAVEQTANLAVQAAYEPGSTIKAITVAAALEQGTIRKNQTFYCEKGRWQYTPEHSIKDTKPSEWLTVTQILAASSNICTTKIYETLGKTTLHRFVRRFHFGERPPIQLPGATAGQLVPPDKWSDIQAANVSFGQGMSSSPLQVAAAFAALANDGVYHPPRIVRKIVAQDGSIVEDLTRPAPERLVRPTTARTVLEMLESVVHSDLGTGKNARVPGYRVAGKTSTAQKAKEGGYDEDLYYASFVGAIPAEAPRVVILVSVDGPTGGHYGNEVAAPTFARVAGRVMTHLGVSSAEQMSQSDAALLVRTDDRRLVEGFIPDVDVEPELPGLRRVARGGALPDFTGLSLSQAFDAAEKARVELRATGTGLAVMQDVPPGQVPEDDVVHVVFEPPG